MISSLLKFIKLFTNKNFLFCCSETEELSESPSVEISFSESLKSRLSQNLTFKFSREISNELYFS